MIAPPARHLPRFLVVTGPDGAGKSHLTSALATLANQHGYRTRIVNFRLRSIDRLLRRHHGDPTSTDPRATPEPSRLGRWLKLMLIWVDLVLTGVTAHLLVRRGEFVLVERYSYDLLIDPRRLGLQRVSGRARRVAALTTPRPERVLLCQVPPQLAAQRKAELSASEIAHIYSAWQGLAHSRRVPLHVVPYSTALQERNLLELLGLPVQAS